MSVPQIVVVVTRMTASPTPARGLGTDSTRMSPGPWNTVARIVPVSSAAGRRVSVSVTVDLSFGSRWAGRVAQCVASRPPTSRHRVRGRCRDQEPKVTQDRDTGLALVTASRVSIETGRGARSRGAARHWLVADVPSMLRARHRKEGTDDIDQYAGPARDLGDSLSTNTRSMWPRWIESIGGRGARWSSSRSEGEQHRQGAQLGRRNPQASSGVGRVMALSGDRYAGPDDMGHSAGSIRSPTDRRSSEPGQSTPVAPRPWSLARS